MKAFAVLLTGSINIEQDIDVSGSEVSIDSSVMSTVLTGTDELAYLTIWSDERLAALTNHSMWKGDSIIQTHNSTLSFADTVEQLSKTSLSA